MCGKVKSFLPFFIVLCILNKIYIMFMIISIACNEFAMRDFGTLFVSSSPQQHQTVSTRIISESLQVYWNVPTFQCKSKGILFKDLYKKYGIHQNQGDSFRGDQVTILYDPGNFPALLENATTKELYFRNGGVPQEGDLKSHLDKFDEQMKLSVPNKHFDGVGIIDFESWRPVFRQNFGKLTVCKNVSVAIEKKRHRLWPHSQVLAEATRRFELAARQFMEATLVAAQRLRPQARWGYYAYPYCYNMASNNMRKDCSPEVVKENDRLSWIWDKSDALYPSLYVPSRLTAEQQASLVRGRAREAVRLARPDAQILPYVWIKYQDNQDAFLTELDFRTTLETVYKSGGSGIVIWGSSNDVNTTAKCKGLLKYVDRVLGPTVAAFTRPKAGEPR